jgi:hypothetical protein
MNNPGKGGEDESKNKMLACINRTCDHQLKNCLNDQAGGGSGGDKSGPVVRDRRGSKLIRPAATLAPQIQPSKAQAVPVTAGSGGANGGEQRVVRDHRAR